MPIYEIPEGMERWTDDYGLNMIVHAKDQCSGRCVIHNPSDHHMVDWPRLWRLDRGLMERICPHGIGHPDPDHLWYLTEHNMAEGGEGIHGCDGCCHDYDIVSNVPASVLLPVRLGQ